MPKLTINLGNGHGPLTRALVKWSLTAPAPVVLVNRVDSSEILSDYTNDSGELELNLESSSWLASQGVEPPTWDIDIPAVGLRASLVMPDEDCTLYDCLGIAAPSVNEPIYRTATRWLDGAGAPGVDLGRDGDWYLQHDGNAWKRESGTWSIKLSLKGPPGGGSGNGNDQWLRELQLAGNRTVTEDEIAGIRLLVARGPLTQPATVMLPDVAFEFRFENKTSQPITIRRQGGSVSHVVVAERSREFSYVP